MSTKTKIIWRLANRPTPMEVTDLLKSGILTKDEAREILFSLETEEERSKKSLQDEIKFLRELVQKLSTNRSVIIETIREVQKPWNKQDWFQPYYVYANSTGGVTSAMYTSTAGGLTGSNSINITGNAATLNAQAQAVSTLTNTSDSFTDIKTF